MTEMAHRQWHFVFLQYEVVSVDTPALFLALMRGLEPDAPPPMIYAMPTEIVTKQSDTFFTEGRAHTFEDHVSGGPHAARGPPI